MPVGNALSVIRKFRPFPPVITSAGTVEWALNQAGFDYEITATNNPTVFDATPIPTGLGINTVTGHLTGTPTVLNVTGTNVTISAKNQTGTGTKVLTIKILPPPPVITSVLTLSGYANSLLTYNIVATNMLANYTPSYGASNLPAGLNVNTTTGLIDGTPTVIGVTNATISAINAGGRDSKTLVIDIKLGPPVITQPANQVNKASGSTFSLQITATNNPTSYSISGVTGLSINSTGLITGNLPTITTNQTYTVTVGALNAAGSAQPKSFTITVVAPPTITVASFGVVDGSTGTSGTPTYTNGPITWSLDNPKPTELGGNSININTSTGVITVQGNSILGGTYQLTVRGENTAGSVTQNVNVLVFAKPPPAVAPTVSLVNSSVNQLKFTKNVYSSFTNLLQATGNPTPTWSATLPAGLRINSVDGTISGTPTGTQWVTGYAITATNTAGSDWKTIFISVA